MSALGKKPSTQAAIRHSVFRAARMLEDRWGDPPTAAELARTAGMSVFHFHRAFAEVVGESVRQHGLRLRTERAAWLLKFSAWQLQEIGATCGFETQAGFSRAFKRFYGVSPMQFRNNEAVVPYLRARKRSRPAPTKPRRRELPEPTVAIERWSDTPVVSLRFYGTMSQLWEPWHELLAWARANVADLERARFFGLWFDDWLQHDGDPRYRYEVAVLPSKPLTGPPPAPFQRRLIPAGRVAVAHVHGPIATLDRGWRGFAYGWLPFSGYQPRLDYVIDEYPADLVLSSVARKMAAGAFGFTLRMCLPVRGMRTSEDE
jgi:AraC family transcriptional regulator